VDDDMTVTPSFIEAHLRAHEGRGMAVIGRIVAAGARPDPWTAWDDAQLDELAECLGNSKQAPGPREFYAGNCSVDAELFRAIGGYNTVIGRGEDFDLGYRLAAAGARFAYCADAPSIHHGAHSFARWVQNAAAFGRSEVTLAREFGHASDFAGWYRDRHPLNRMLISLCSRFPRLRTPLIRAIDLAGRACYAVGATRIGIAAHSAIYNLAYWHGLIEAFGAAGFWSDAGRPSATAGVPSAQ
jgi:GT2 family glycosyltransferase